MSPAGGPAGSEAELTARASHPSSPAGVLFGAGFGYAGYLIGQEPERGYRYASVVSGLMAGVMGHRVYKTGKVMPAGLLTGVALASLGYHGMKYSEWTA